jgi:hypothetical protein
LRRREHSLSYLQAVMASIGLSAKVLIVGVYL